MTSYRTFQISSELFWGYQVIVDVSIHKTIDAVVALVKQDMKQFFMQRNLQVLVEKIQQMQLHMHAPVAVYSDILKNTKEDEIIYLCDHCQLR